MKCKKKKNCSKALCVEVLLGVVLFGVLFAPPASLSLLPLAGGKNPALSGCIVC